MSKDVLETGVDSLVRLLNGKNRISVPEAAKELGVTVKNVNEWVDFLQEEGKVGVEYKFTTPYVYLNDSSKSIKSTKAKINSSDANSDNSVQEETTEKTNSVGSAISNLENSNGKLSNKSLDASDFSKNQNIPAEVEESEIVEAENINSGSDVQNAYDNRLKNLLNPEQKKSQSDIGVVNEMFTEIESLLDSGDITHANVKYRAVKEFISKLPKGDETDLLNTKLVGFNQKFLESMNNLSNKMGGQINEIDSLLVTGDQQLNSGDVVSAKKTYSVVFKIYQSIPNIFSEQKKLLYSKIFDFYKNLITREFSNASDIINAKAKEIDILSLSLEKNLGKNLLSAANSDFSKINTVYKNLPSGFLQQKLSLHSKILKLFEEIKIVAKLRELHNKMKIINPMLANQFGLGHINVIPLPEEIEAAINDSSDDTSSEGNAENLADDNVEGVESDQVQQEANSEISQELSSESNQNIEKNSVESNDESDVVGASPIETNLNQDQNHENLVESSSGIDSLTTDKSQTYNAEVNQDGSVESNLNEPSTQNVDTNNMTTAYVSSESNNNVETSVPNSPDQDVVVNPDEMFNRGVELYNAKKYLDSKSVFENIVKHYPNHAKANQMLQILNGLNENQVETSDSNVAPASNLNSQVIPQANQVIPDNQMNDVISSQNQFDNSQISNSVEENNAIPEQNSSFDSHAALIDAISSASIGHFSEAKTMLENLLKIEPDNEEAKTLYKAIKEKS